MTPFYFTFGQKYRHEPHRIGGHPDGWVVVEAETEESARAIMSVYCGLSWAACYNKQPDKVMFPRGEIKRLSP